MITTQDWGQVVSKLNFTFRICSIRFTTPMLFDEKKMPFHLMLNYFFQTDALTGVFIHQS